MLSISSNNTMVYRLRPKQSGLRRLNISATLPLITVRIKNRGPWALRRRGGV